MKMLYLCMYSFNSFPLKEELVNYVLFVCYQNPNNNEYNNGLNI